MKRITLAALLAALIIGTDLGVAAAQTSRPTSRVRDSQDRTAGRKPSKPRRVRGLSWYGDVESALGAAVKRRGKPVFLVRVLGDLTGDT